jgi:copper(I)-binding protein
MDSSRTCPPPAAGRLLAATASILLALAGCGPKPDVAVEQARLVLPVAPGRPAALYFTASSRTGEGRLVGLASPRAERIELHETRTDNGVSRMIRIPAAGFDDSGRIEFAPGGRHAMAFGLDPALKPGDTIPLTFAFDQGPKLAVEAEVRAFGEGHGGH